MRERVAKVKLLNPSIELNENINEESALYEPTKEIEKEDKPIVLSNETYLFIDPMIGMEGVVSHDFMNEPSSN